MANGRSEEEVEGRMEAFTHSVEDDFGLPEFSAISDSGFIAVAETRRDFQDDLPLVVSISSTSVSEKKLALFEGPVLLQRLNVFEEVELGGKVTFECQCKAFPLPVTKWYKDDVELVESDRIKIENSLETDGILRLVISNCRKSDEGAYRCKLENQEGVAATTGYLSVTGSNASPKSDHAISAAPLLRAITEESNASQDADDITLTSIDKILTGEYDLGALPYSQYLELLKGSDSSTVGIDPSNTSLVENLDNNGGSRTPTETAQNDDVISLSRNTFSESQIPISNNNDVTRFSDDLVTMETCATNQTPTVEKMDEKMEETIIAGRMGLPTGWEFAHYTPEADDAEDTLKIHTLSSDSANPSAVAVIMEQQELNSEIEAQFVPKDEDVFRDTIEAEQGKSVLELDGSPSNEDNLVNRDTLLRGVTLLRDSLRGDVQPPSEKKEEELTLLPAEKTDYEDPALGKTPEITPKTGLTNGEPATPIEEQNTIGSIATDREYIQSPSATGGITETKAGNEGEGSSRIAEITSGLVSGVSSLVSWNTKSTVAGEVKDELPPQVGDSSGDRSNKKSGESVGSLLSNLVSDLSPSVSALADWIPEVPSISSYLPGLTPDNKLEKTRPVDLEEIDVSILPEEGLESQTVIEWWIDWFRFPWLFYILLALVSTLLASATQSEPSLLIILVALFSLLGFHLFPVQETKNKNKPLPVEENKNK